MARSVLIAALSLWAVGSTHAADVVPCASARGVERRAAASLFYKDLATRLGRPLTCKAELEGRKTTITYAFRYGARLIAMVDPSAELSEQRIEAVEMDSAKAMALLKRAERDSYRPHGCGIEWSKPDEESGEVVYRGDTCNCQARLTIKSKTVVALVLRSAC